MNNNPSNTTCEKCGLLHWSKDCPSNEASIRNKAREIIRAYYNHTFEYSVEQLQKGNFASVIANAEAKQQALDDPYLDQLEALFAHHQLQLLQRVEDEVQNYYLGCSEHCPDEAKKVEAVPLEAITRIRTSIEKGE